MRAATLRRIEAAERRLAGGVVGIRVVYDGDDGAVYDAPVWEGGRRLTADEVAALEDAALVIHIAYVEDWGSDL